MRKWVLLLASAAVAVTGCGGAGGGGGGTGGGGGGGTLVSRVNDTKMSNPAVIYTTFLSGQGRAPGSQSAQFKRMTYTPLDFDNPVETVLNPAILVLLDGYTHNTITIGNAPTLAGQDSRLFDTFTLRIQKILEDTGDPLNPYVEFSNPNDPNAPILDEPFPLRLRTFSGRQSIVQIFIDDAMVHHDGVDLNFDQALFELANIDPDAGEIRGFISDYLRFDLTSMGAGQRPNLISPEGMGASADAVYFSGDAIALSAVVGGERVFEVLTPLGHIAGQWRLPTPLTPEFGTYTLLEADPRILPVPNAQRLVALQGIWRNYNDMILDLGTVEMFALPNSDDSDDQDAVMIQRDGAGNISAMYFGFVNYSTGDFSMFPIDQVDDGAAGNELVGTVSSFLDASGNSVNAAESTKIRSGTFAFSAGAPAGFPASGRFLVFRK